MTERVRERPGRLARLATALGVTIAFFFIYLAAEEGPLLRPLELQTLDWRFRLRGPVAPGPEVVLVVIDDRTVARLGRWPVPRDVIGDAIERIARAGARVIGLDLLFPEASPSLGPALRRLIERARESLTPEDARLRTELDRALATGDPDMSLAVAIAAADRVVTPYAFVFQGREGNIAGVPPWIRETAYPVYTIEDGGPPQAPDGASGLLIPTAQLAAVGTTAGHVTLLLDADGALRFDLPVFAHGERFFPSLPVEVARLHLGLARDEVVVRFNRGLELGPHFLPTDARMRHLINYYGPPGTIETHALIDLLEGRLPDALLAGRIVLLGATVAGAGDQFNTPYARRLPGTEHLATAIDNILHDRALVRDRRTRLVDLVAIVLLASAAAVLVGRRSHGWSTVISLGLPLAWVLLVFLAFVLWGWWLTLLVPAAAAFASAGVMEGLYAGEEQARRRRLERQRSNLARYFPPPVVERLAGADRPIRLDRTQLVAVMFTDIVGFTKLSENLPPDEAMALLRAFHSRVERAVFAHGGMVDKFVGDGAMACFGVPDETPVAATAALAAGRDLAADLEAWRAERLRTGEPPIRAGIGIHYGPVLMGDIGGRQQFQFTVIGDAVNTASRLETLTRTCDTELIVSQALLDALSPDAAPALIEGLEPMEPMRVRGREEVMRLWRLRRPALAAA
jgi:adenylate cyclase